jgi:hypothetical protein
MMKILQCFRHCATQSKFPFCDSLARSSTASNSSLVSCEPNNLCIKSAAVECQIAGVLPFPALAPASSPFPRGTTLFD